MTTASLTVPQAGAGRSLGAGDVVALMGRRLRHLRRNPGKLVAVALNPLVMIVVLGYLFKDSIAMPGNQYQEYVFAGVAAQVALTTIGPTAIGIADDLRNGLVDRFRTLSISRTAVLVAHTLVDLISAAATLVLVAGVGLIIGWRSHAGVLPTLGAFALLLAFIWTMMWVGIMLGLLMGNLETIQSTGALVLVVLSFVSNAFLPPQGMPGWLAAVAAWNPVSAVATACRTLWENPVASSGGFADSHPIPVALVGMAVILAVAIPLSARAYASAATR